MNIPPVLRVLFASFFFFGAAAFGQTNLPFLHPLFTSHMVLQRDAVDPVWGWTSVGSSVSVTVKDQNNATVQTVVATAGSDGRWQANVGPFSAVAGNAAYSLVITGSSTATTLSDVLIGDVWLCSGQSNMEYTLFGNYPPGSGGTRMANSTNEIAAAVAAGTFIRHFKVSRGTTATTPQETFIGGVDSGGWTTSSNATAFTAVGYFMAKQIYASQNVPIGLLNITWGSTDILPWISADTLRTLSDYTTAIDSGVQTQGYYNAMISPARRFQIKGGVWYQGESSTAQGGPKYGALLTLLRSDWRAKFNQATLPFIAVQLCTNGAAQTTPVEATSSNSYAEIREAQAKAALADTNSALAVTLDGTYIDPATAVSGGTYNANVHPIDKQTMGLRVGQAVLKLVYGQTTPYTSPTFNHADISGNTMRCYFDNVGSGLMVGLKPQGLSPNATPSPSPVQVSPSGTLTGFAIAGANKTFYNATATLDPATNTVVVTSPSVASPLYVRYGWHSNPWNTALGSPLTNLYRKVLDGSSNIVDGVPVSPFRNDPVVQLSVNSGAGSGSTYLPGAVVNITPNGAPSGQAFAFWSGDTDLLANASASSTTATLARTYVSVRAIYKLNAAPVGLSATAASLSAQLSWTALANAISYNVKRSSSANGTYTTLATGLLTASYTDNSPGFGTPWFYKISATNAAGESPDSAAVSVTPLPPAAPTALVADAGNGLISLTWNSVPNATSYTLSQATVSGGPYHVISSITGNSYVNTGLTNGTAYYYVVAAAYGNSVGPASSEATATPSTSTALINRARNGTATGTGNGGNSAQGPAAAFDGSLSTKFYGVVTVSVSTPVVLQYKFGGSLAWAITQYQFATGNDTQARDPKDWTLQGSNDGMNWTVVDTRVGQIFGAPRNTYVPAYVVSNPGTYRYYQVVITATYGSGNGSQFDELLLLSPPTDAGDKTPPVITTPADITVPATSPSGAAVSFSVTAQDAVGGAATPTITPASGSVFPIGTTVVQCSATDPVGNSAMASFNVTVQNSFTAYLQQYFSNADLQDNAKTGATVDYDHDGSSNLLEYFQGTAPTASDGAGSSSAVSDGNGNLIFTFRMAKNLSGISYVIQKSPDLAGWSPTGVAAQMLSDQGSYFIMQATVPNGGGGKLFVRLYVTAP